jgi:PhnB protein
MAVKPVPDGYGTVIPYLVLADAAAFIEFTKTAMGATEVRRFPAPDGRVGHAELRIGDSIIMLGDSNGESSKWPAMLHLYVPDCDASFKRAVDAGCTPLREPGDNPDGDRRGGVSDRWGNEWWFATHVQDP